jgi:hypothetical protein
MLSETPDDRFDDVRREWIARHASVFPIQKRRAEVLNRRIRDRQRKQAGARPSPYNDNLIKPLILRPAQTVEGYIEAVAVSVAAVLAPIGWLAGFVLYLRIVGLIPQRLRSYPVLPLLWAGVAAGVLTVCFYRHGTELSSALLVPWFVAQIPATLLTASVYGVLNGWLAVDGATEWWPLTPRQISADPDYPDSPMGPDDMTSPGIFFQDDLDVGEHVTPIATDEPGAQGRATTLIVAGLVASTLGIVWTIAIVGLGTRDALVESTFAPPSTSNTVQPWGGP